MTSNIPLGIGALETDPLYGLLDIDQNFFYIVSHREEFIKLAHTMASPYKSTKILKISNFDNWHHNLIDNQVCMNWGIDLLDSKKIIKKYQNTLDKNFVITAIETNVPLDKNLKIIINNFQLALKLFEHLEGLELMIKTLPFPHAPPDQNLALAFVDDPWVLSAINQELKEYEYYQNAIVKFKNTIFENFCQDITNVDYITHYNKQVELMFLNLSNVSFITTKSFLNREYFNHDT